MSLESRLTLSTCLLALVISTVPVQSGSSVETNSASIQGRVRRRHINNYNPWSVQPNRRNSVSLFEASSVFKPAPYSITRPYYIPVYGTPGRPLIFYPPQPLYVNPGRPVDNPLKPPYEGPAYLPPKESPHFSGGDKYLPPKETGPTTPKQPGIVFRGGDDDEDDAPIWGGSDGKVVQMPLSGGENEPVPTRVPIARPTQPSLVHEAAQSRPNPPPQSFQRPTLRTTTPSPPSGPSNCVWAIISCCSAANPSFLPQNCFEQRGCPGPFWGSSPCESDYARSAIEAAVKYYNPNPGVQMGK